MSKPVPVLERYMIVSGYMHNQTEESWQNLLRRLRPYVLTPEEAAGPEAVAALRQCYDVIDYVTAENMAEFIGVDHVRDAYQAAEKVLKKVRASAKT